MKRVIRSPENITLAIDLQAQGVSLAGIGDRFGVSESTIRLWVDPDKYVRHQARAVQWQQFHKDVVNSRQRKRNAKMDRAEKDAVNAYQKHRYATNPAVKATFNRLARKYRLTAQGCIGHKIRLATLSYSNRIHSVYRALSAVVTGLTMEEFTQKLIGEGHLDHIVPVCSFELTRPEHVVRVMHHTNIQLLTPQENMRKRYSGRLDDVMHLPWVGTQTALDTAQAFISRCLHNVCRKRSIAYIASEDQPVEDSDLLAQ